MGDCNDASTPKLAGPILAALQDGVVPAASAGLLAIGLATAVVWFNASDRRPIANGVPLTPSDLSERVVTPIDPADRFAVEAAVSLLRLPDAQRLAIEHEVLERRRGLAWIVLTDSMDPDGDTVAIEASGLVQHVVLTKAWMPVAVPLDGTGPITITAVRDGGGGGVTVALATRSGPVTLRIMLPGERVEVMP